MENKKIIFLNAVFSFLMFLMAIGYFELRTINFLKKNNPTNNPISQNNILEQASLTNPNNEDPKNQEPEPIYEEPKDLSYSGSQVPGFASGEIVSVSEEEFVLKQSASIDLRYQVFKKDVEKITEIVVIGSRDDPKKEPRTEEKTSDWSNIKVGSKINMRLDENQKRIVSIVTFKAE